MKITPTSLTLNQLFGSSNEQYVIPSYQRRYSWRERQVYELLDDIDLLEGSDTHLLGNIVCLTGSHAAGLNKLDLVDGQQRLTTISILFECIRQHLMEQENTELASDLGRLLHAKTIDGKELPKVLLDSIDSKEFARLVKADDQGDFVNENLFNAFTIVRDWISEQELKDLIEFLYRLQNQALLIRLDVSDAKDAFKLFETINNRGLRLSPSDIIKNFLLGNAARFGEDSLKDACDAWAKLVLHLDRTSSDNFFRHFLTARTQRRVTAAKVVPIFKALFMREVREAVDLPDRHYYFDEDDVDTDNDENDGETSLDRESSEEEKSEHPQLSFKSFLKKLVESAKIYGRLLLASTGNKSADRHLRNLHMIKAAQTFGYLMHLKVGGCDEKHFLTILKLTEAFVLRRHICRERSNDTETLFARLCAVNPKNPVPDTRVAYRASCPSDEKFREEFANVMFTSNIIDRARYCLESIEIAKHGKYVELQVLGTDLVHVEHIIPKKIKTIKAKEEFGDWVTYLGEKSILHHPKYLSRIGNLTLFSGKLNISASNNPFSGKRPAYRESSILMTQEIGKMQNFRFKQVEQRSKDLADSAVELWPVP